MAEASVSAGAAEEAAPAPPPVEAAAPKEVSDLPNKAQYLEAHHLVVPDSFQHPACYPYPIIQEAAAEKEVPVEKAEATTEEPPAEE